MISILAEANQRVATGHFMEAIELAEYLLDSGEDVVLFVNDSCPQRLLDRIECPNEKYYYMENDNMPTGCIIELLQRYSPEVLITDLREIPNKFLKELHQQYDGKIICIDEWGKRHLDADIIINPMVDSYFWDYPGTKAKLYRGAEYLILPKKMWQYRGSKTIKKNIDQICVSMGGVDVKGTTLKLAEWIPRIGKDSKIELVLGAGFFYNEELTDLINDNLDIKVYRNVENIYEHFISADIVFCAGGNTLHELACLGVPAVTIPTMPHEERNGRFFEKNGFGKCLPIADYVDESDVVSVINEMRHENIRRKMSEAGRSITDGEGVIRTAQIVEGIIAKK